MTTFAITTVTVVIINVAGNGVTVVVMMSLLWTTAVYPSYMYCYDDCCFYMMIIFVFIIIVMFDYDACDCDRNGDIDDASVNHSDGIHHHHFAGGTYVLFICAYSSVVVVSLLCITEGAC